MEQRKQRSRLAKRNLLISRLELMRNVEKEINKRVVSLLGYWSDSTVALYWIKGKGDYWQFVANRVAKIQSHTRVEGHHIPTKQNPANIGGCSRSVVETTCGTMVLNGWKTQQNGHQRKCSQQHKNWKRKGQQRIYKQWRRLDNQLLGKFLLRKVIKIRAWIYRFGKSCRVFSDNLKKGTFNVRGRQQARVEQKTQKEAKKDPESEDIQLQLNI